MDYEALDGALMVLVGESDYGETLIITWFGKSQLNLHDDTLQIYEYRAYDHPIRDAAHARVLAKDWLADLIVADEMVEDEA